MFPPASSREGKMTQATPKKQYKVGVLFVHGMGEQAKRDTLRPRSEALLNWLNRWIKGAGIGGAVAGSSAEPASLSDPLIRPAPADSPAPEHTQLSFRIPGSDERSTWLLGESHWAPAVAPPTYFELLRSGLLVVPWVLTSHFGARLRRARLIKVLPNFGYFIFAVTLLNPLIVLLELAVLILGLIPMARVRSFVGSIQRLMTMTAGDIYVFLRSEDRLSTIVGQVRSDLEWLAKKCERVAI
jgi:hypothetical protein